MLRHPAFPDLVVEWAADDEATSRLLNRANYNEGDQDEAFWDRLLGRIAEAEIAANRLW